MSKSVKGKKERVLKRVLKNVFLPDVRRKDSPTFCNALRLSSSVELVSNNQPPSPSAAVRQLGQVGRYVELRLFQQGRQAIQVLGPKHLAEPAYGEEELATAGDPARAVGGQGPGGG